ncbi:hypothetical protein A2344_01745 [Candidatus Peregrinibacteria bacterium RIFOXYB12_FULL_41_12]|nr:MAG: hypothetical protein A2244_02895 [Candidatus Peregrinibacteria bacterium RIFOXYA2_FULL_41_18]OGJ49565.1 MAG: hypothetical protein A2344_01745 [Candidatus Peregrinibacteria bacterium RIFOXYB12_FULL_41_12]
MRNKKQIIQHTEVFRSVIEKITTGVWVADKHDRIYFVNKGITKIAGIDKKSMVGLNVLKDFGEETLKYFRPIYLRAKKTLKKISYDSIPVLTPAGVQSYQSGWIIPLKKNGKFDGILCTVKDVTFQEQAKEKFALGKKELEIAVDNSKQLIYNYNITKGDIKWSGAIKEVTGYSKKDFEKMDIKKWSEYIHPMDRYNTLKGLDAAAKNITRYSEEYRFKHKNGSYVYIEDQGIFLKNKDGSIRMLGTMKDISERKRIEHDLIQSNKKYRELFELSGDGMLIVDANKHEVKEANIAAAGILGYTVSELKGMSCNNILDKNSKATCDLMSGENLFFQKKPLVTMEIKKKDGSKIFVEANSTIIVSEGEKIMIVALRDITQKKEVDRMKTEFISLVSHQLRTPLSAIRWAGEMLKDKELGSLNAEQLDILTDINTLNQKMIDLVNSLLNLSKIESGKITVEKKPVDIPVILQGIVSVFQEKILNKNLKIIISKQKGIKKVTTDPKLLSEIYFNLISNAIKYSNDGGSVTISILEKGNEIISSIKDEGIGIPADEEKKIFERFFRGVRVTRKDTEGIGLGLYITKLIVEALGGKVWLDGKAKKGSTFYFSIPKKIIE